MSFFAVLLALVIEQVRALPRDNPIQQALVAWAGWTRRNLDAGREHHAWVVWAVTVVAPSLIALALYLLLHRWSVLLALLFDVGVLYLSLGFRQFSHWFTDIRDALDRGDEAQARRMLARWRHLDASELPRAELLRHVIEHALLAAHRNVFGVFFWFVLLSSLGLGPAGAVLYRMAGFAARHWPVAGGGALADERLAAVSQRMADLIDLVPSRLTAFGFAVVGNFEEAVNAWRRDSTPWARSNESVILASAAGAVGVQLGGAPGGFTEGEPPQMGHLRSVVGLVWRSVVLWMLVVALLTLANLVG
jgi:adenosylcobinamide-phosphate synthase